MTSEDGNDEPVSDCTIKPGTAEGLTLTSDDFGDAKDAAISAHEWMDGWTPVLVHHYTSIGTLAKILTTNSGRVTLYASDADYMNDVAELQLYPAALHEVFRERYKEGAPLVRAVGDRLIHHWLDERMWTTYALSFTVLEDDLSQWRLYGDDGAGACVTFWYDKIVQAVSEQFGNLAEVRACRYVSQEDAVKNRAAHALFDALDPGIQRRSDNAQKLDRYMDVGLGHSTALEGPLFKLDDYKAEGEFRVVVRSMPRRRDVDNTESHKTTPSTEPMPFIREARPSGSEIIPYISVDLTDAICSIRLGPKIRHDFNRRRYGLRALIDGAPFAGVDILSSDHPYRG